MRSTSVVEPFPIVGLRHVPAEPSRMDWKMLQAFRVGKRDTMQIAEKFEVPEHEVDRALWRCRDLERYEAERALRDAARRGDPK